MEPKAACELARSLLIGVGSRWRHTEGVARRAEEVAGVAGVEASLLVSAAWLHDVGYAPALVNSGLHPLDGARHLHRLGVDPTVVQLVAYHTGARVEAKERGLADELAVFAPPDPVLLDAVTCADVTTGPDGRRVTVDERLAEILERYDDGGPVHRAVQRSAPQLRAAVERTEARLRARVA